MRLVMEQLLASLFLLVQAVVQKQTGIVCLCACCVCMCVRVVYNCVLCVPVCTFSVSFLLL